jgi:hypothetical protein
MRELHSSHVGEKAKAIGENPACRGGGDRWMSMKAGAILRPQPVPTWRLKMQRLIVLALTFAMLAIPAGAVAQPVQVITVNCGSEPPAGGDAPILHGTWDFLMDANGTPNFGLLSLGYVDKEYGGSLSLWSTAPVVLREYTVTGSKFHMAVASPDGDVLFDGVLSAKGDRMCGIVTYHGGRKFAALARKRPMTYQSLPRAQRAR